MVEYYVLFQMETKDYLNIFTWYGSDWVHTLVLTSMSMLADDHMDCNSCQNDDQSYQWARYNDHHFHCKTWVTCGRKSL